MSDLKQELAEYLDDFFGRVPRPSEVADLRARLQRATVTEHSSSLVQHQEITLAGRMSALERRMRVMEGFTLDIYEQGRQAGLRHALKATETPAPPPTDALSEAELRERLQAALPRGWEVGDGLSDGTFYIQGPRGFVGYPSQAALRKPGGIEACARALRVLAGVEE